MDGMPEYVVDPNMRFSDIIVPTIDTVRAHFLLELLISNVKQVRCVIKNLALGLILIVKLSLFQYLAQERSNICFFGGGGSEIGQGH